MNINIDLLEKMVLYRSGELPAGESSTLRKTIIEEEAVRRHWQLFQTVEAGLRQSGAAEYPLPKNIRRPATSHEEHLLHQLLAVEQARENHWSRRLLRWLPWLLAAVGLFLLGLWAGQSASDEDAGAVQPYQGPVAELPEESEIPLGAAGKGTTRDLTFTELLPNGDAAATEERTVRLRHDPQRWLAYELLDKELTLYTTDVRSLADLPMRWRQTHNGRQLLQLGRQYYEITKAPEPAAPVPWDGPLPPGM